MFGKIKSYLTDNQNSDLYSDRQTHKMRNSALFSFIQTYREGNNHMNFCFTYEATNQSAKRAEKYLQLQKVPESILCTPCTHRHCHWCATTKNQAEMDFSIHAKYQSENVYQTV